MGCVPRLCQRSVRENVNSIDFVTSNTNQSHGKPTCNVFKARTRHERQCVLTHIPFSTNSCWETNRCLEFDYASINDCSEISSWQTLNTESDILQVCSWGWHRMACWGKINDVQLWFFIRAVLGQLKQRTGLKDWCISEWKNKSHVQS